MQKPHWTRDSDDHFTTTWEGRTYTLTRHQHAQWWLHEGGPSLEPADFACDGAWRSIPAAQEGAAIWLHGWRIDPPRAEDGTVLYRRGQERRPYTELCAELGAEEGLEG